MSGLPGLTWKRVPAGIQADMHSYVNNLEPIAMMNGVQLMVRELNRLV